MEPAPCIRVSGLTKTYHGAVQEVLALDDISFDVAPGEIIAIVGPSGCGKSTVLNALAGLDWPTEGRLEICGRPIAGIQPEIGYVFQKDTVFPWRTVSRNVALGLEYRGLPGPEISARVAAALKVAGLAEFAHAHPSTLSGGMRQRVALMRTLILEPAILLLDEPFGALDSHTKMILQDHLLDQHQRYHPAVVLVTHDLSEAITLADRVMVMTQRPGRIRATHRIDLPRPRDVFGMRQSEEYHAKYRTIWRDLQDQFKKDVA